MAMDREREENGTVAVEGGGQIEKAESNDSGHVQEIFRVIESIAQLGDYRRSHRKECCALARRINLLLPLLEEVRDIECGGGPIPEEVIVFLQSLKDALLSATKLLKTCNEGSKIYLVVETESVMTRFQRVNEALSKSLKGVPYDELGISVEVEEQIELLQVQLKRAKRRTDTQDMEFAMDMMVLFSEENGQNADRASVERLAKKLEVHTFEDLENETLAIRNLTTERGGRDMDSTQKITDLLNKFRQIFGMGVVDVLHNPVMPKTLAKRPSLIIPHEFLCPITLAIMTDPVIVASGQTYERESIEKWFDSNHRTCPKTRQTLAHMSLAPNYALKNLILQWCEQNNYQLPKKDVLAGSESFCSENSEAVSALVRDLSSSALEVQRKAVKKIRILSKENQDCRTSIANSGGIPPLVQLLSYPDSKIQENAVTSLLNLSLNETNKKLIAQEGAIPAIIEVLQSGSTEARENSAATLFSLSMVDENKVAVGLSNGIPPLVELLQKGTIRGKKDAAYALFNLCLNHANKGAAIEAGIVPPLLKLLNDEQVGMVDEALSIFLLLASHPEGRNAIGQLSFMETLVSFIGQGTPKNKECATSVLLELCSKNPNLLLAALQFGVYEHLIEISRNGTDRAKRKANALLDLMSKSEQI